MSRVFMIIKELGNSQKAAVVFKIALVVLLTSIITISVFSMSYSDEVNKGLADNLIRLHVIANSDSEEDQELKRDIRDLVVDYMKNELKDSRDLEQTKYIINANLPIIKDMAEKEVLRHGKQYPVKAMLGTYPFPTKAYGDIVLPAGNYQALRVVIGKGEGTNWWCVLFPPLCFVDATHGTVSDDVKDRLKNLLTEEEYNIIVSADSDADIPIKIKFKIVEFFQDSKIRFTGIINKIFKGDD